MRIVPIGVYEKYGIKEVPGKTLPKILTGIQRVYGQGFWHSLQRVKIIFYSITEEIQPIALSLQLVNIDISQYDSMAIVPEIEGEFPAALMAVAAMALPASGTVLGSTMLYGFLQYAIATLIVMAISIAISMLIQAIMPTPTTHKAKEAQKKDSNLWNGNQATMLQGGPLPMIFGNPFCGGGAIIASGLSTEDTVVNSVANPIGV